MNIQEAVDMMNRLGFVVTVEGAMGQQWTRVIKNNRSLVLYCNYMTGRVMIAERCITDAGQIEWKVIGYFSFDDDLEAEIVFASSEIENS